MVGINNNLTKTTIIITSIFHYHYHLLHLTRTGKKLTKNSTATAISSQPTTEGHAPSGYVPLRLCPAGGARPPSAGGQAGTRWGMS